MQLAGRRFVAFVASALMTVINVASFNPINGMPFMPRSGESLRSAVKSDCAPPPGQVHDVRSAEDFNKLTATGQLVVADFFAQWCGPCQNFKPTFQKMAEEQTDILFCKIDVDESKELAAEYAISSMPTFKASCRTISKNNSMFIL